MERVLSKKVGLSRVQILESAHELLKSEGVSAVSMRRVADALGTAPMSLYTYVKNKEDLLEGVLALVLGNLEVRVDFSTGNWQEQVATWMYSLREQLNSNPEIFPLFRSQGRYSEAYLSAVDLLISILKPTGLSEKEIIKNVRLINWTVFGFVLIESSAPTSDDETISVINRLVYADIGDLFTYQVEVMIKGLSALINNLD